jgi:hypothetical protein
MALSHASTLSTSRRALRLPVSGSLSSLDPSGPRTRSVGNGRTRGRDHLCRCRNSEASCGLRESQAQNSTSRVPWTRNDETRVSESLWAVQGHMANGVGTRDPWHWHPHSQARIPDLLRRALSVRPPGAGKNTAADSQADKRGSGFRPNEAFKNTPAAPEIVPVLRTRTFSGGLGVALFRGSGFSELSIYSRMLAAKRGVPLFPTA